MKPWKLRERVAGTLDDVADASTTVQNAAAVHTLVLVIVGIGVIVALGMAVHALNRPETAHA